MITELEKELNLEKARRNQMNAQFERELRKFQEDQKALEMIKEANRRMERGQLDPGTEARRLEDELDKVPQREKNPIEKMPHLKPVTPKPTFNPSRIKSSIPSAKSKQSEHMKQVIAAKKR